jgi:hypothetical protein
VTKSPVLGKGTLATCCTPFTERDMFLALALPLAKRKESVTVWLPVERSEKVRLEPTTLSRFA